LRLFSLIETSKALVIDEIFSASGSKITNASQSLKGIAFKKLTGDISEYLIQLLLIFFMYSVIDKEVCICIKTISS
jgi:hypothetical protein